tara:strand:+ start:262 stop:417 length:156 start_codon:yes stop_codon:yes gene_type:complete
MEDRKSYGQKKEEWEERRRKDSLTYHDIKMKQWLIILAIILIIVFIMAGSG